MRLSDAVPKGKLASSPYPSPRASELHKILQAGLFIARVGEMLKQGSGEKDLIRAQPGEHFEMFLADAPDPVRLAAAAVLDQAPELVQADDGLGDETIA
jgi:hypothetical protein